MTKPESVSLDRDGCMPNVAQSVGTCAAAANCHAEARAKQLFSLGRVSASNKLVRGLHIQGTRWRVCCCSWRTRPASGSLPRPAESDRFAWWVHPRALGSRTSGCAQILDKEALAYQGGQPLTGHASFLSTLAMWMAWQDRYSPVRGDVPYYHSLCCLDSKFVSWSPERHQPVSSGVLSRLC